MFSHNITDGLESTTYRWSKVSPTNMLGSPTGESETFTFTGSEDYLKNTLAPTHLATASEALQVNCSLSRLPGGMAELTVTKTGYIAAPEDDPSTPGTGLAGATGTSSAAPIVQIDVAEAQDPIMTHPTVTAAGFAPDSPQFIALNMLASGHDMMATFSTPDSTDGSPVVWTVFDALRGVGADVIALVQSASSYLVPNITMTIKWALADDAAVPSFGQYFTIQTPENAPSVSGGRNWLYLGGGMTLEGGSAMVVKKYKLSGPGGWNSAVYP